MIANFNPLHSTHLPVAPVAEALNIGEQAVRMRISRRDLQAVKHRFFGVLIPVNELDAETRKTALSIYARMLQSSS